jgi:hypothetical protein
MGFYPNAASLHACLTHMLARVEHESPEKIALLSAAQLTVRFRFRAPNTQLFFDGRRRPFRISRGESPARADLEAELSADTLHQVLLGRLSVAHAVGSRLIAVRGPVWKAYPLVDLFEAGRQVYPAVLVEQKLVKRGRRV